jgi:hypothetical protein
MRIRITLAAVVIALVTLAPWVAHGSQVQGGQGSPTVLGRIVDRDQKPVEGVRIRAIQAGSRIGEVRSGPDGAYSLNVPSGGASFDLVFDGPGWQPALFQALAIAARHQITKVLLRDGEVLDPRSALAAEYADRYLRTIGG